MEGPPVAEARRDPNVVLGGPLDEDPLLLDGALPDQPLAGLEVGGEFLPLLVGVGPEEPHVRQTVLGDVDVEDPVLGLDDRGQLGEKQARHRLEFLLPLHHRGEPGEVGLEPVLVLVLLRRLPEVADHRVDVLA